jgi:hypothetical protein
VKRHPAFAAGRVGVNMNPVNLSTNLAAWMMLAATLLSIGFLIWFLVGVMIEGKKKTIGYVICSDYAQRPLVHMFTEGHGLGQEDDTKSQHAIRFNANHITTGALRKAPRLGSI